MTSSCRSAILALLAAMTAALAMAVVAPADAVPSTPLVSNPAALVNPLIGTSGGGNTSPAPDMPFGMIQWGPDTANPRRNGGGYEYDANQLLGFSLDRLSGAGCPVYGDVPILPMVGAIPSDPANAVNSFSHADETAQAGYYQVTSTSPGTQAPVATRLTTATRSGIAEFGFPPSTRSNLLIKVAASANKQPATYQKVYGTSAQVVGNDEVTGSVTAGNFCNIGDDKHPNYTLYFDIRFDRPFTTSGTWPGGPSGNPGGLALTFDTTTTQKVTAKVGISYTSATNAALNLTTEIPGWDFDAVHTANVDAWNQMLNRIQIGGGNPSDQTQFYTALYHSLLDPHVYSDVNGEYTGMDGKIHQVVPGHAQYADYSGWDIYRDQVQLIALLVPDRTSDIVTSMLSDYSQDGMLPKWTQGNAETYEMVGDPADAIIADAYAFGARDFDTGKALAAMVAEATQPGNIRPGQQQLDHYGYLPTDGSHGCCHFYGSVSTQLEYDTADYAIAAFAKALGDQAGYVKFASRAQNWQNTFNPATGYVQARRTNGQWSPDFTPETTTGMVEGTAAQYTPMVPFNLQALIAARGGNQAWNDFLDTLLTNITDPGPTNANLGNEPGLEIPWEYDYTGTPWKAQHAVRQAQTQLYANAPVGEQGNDDLGAMSSWYVWSTLGFYPETPGTDTLVIGSPAFPHATVHLGNGRQLVINAPDAAPDAPYVQDLRLDGDGWPKTYLTGNQYLHGATLNFDLGTNPSDWGSGPNAAPPSDSTGQAPAIPYLGNSGVVVTSAGSNSTTTLGAQNVTDQPTTVTANASVAPGSPITVSPSQFTLRLAAGGRAEQTLAIHAPSDLPPGDYEVPIILSAPGENSSLAAAILVVHVPASLAAAFNNAGVSDDGNVDAAAFDSVGDSYSAQSLAAQGISPGAGVQHGGVTFTWPDVAPGTSDNVVAQGQTIALSGSGTKLGILGAASGGDASGTGTVRYTDGTSSSFTLTLGDWWNGPIAGNEAVASMPYVNSQGIGGRERGQRDHTVYLFSTAVPVTAGKQVAAVTLPTGGSISPGHISGMHLFALAVG